MKMSAECLHLTHAAHVRRRHDGNQICCNIRLAIVDARAPRYPADEY